MAKKIIRTQYRCRDCKHSYNWHEIAADTGQPFMCYCPHYTEGKYCKFLSDNQSDKFELKNGNTRV